jgi:hypothetical protein
MPRISERYPKSGFLTAKDVEEEGDLDLQIAYVAWDEEIGNKTRDVVHFLNDGRALVLNATNARTVAKLHGDEADDWSGRWVTLFFDPDVEYQGRKDGGIRVREQVPACAEGSSTTTQARPPAPPFDDEISF